MGRPSANEPDRKVVNLSFTPKDHDRLRRVANFIDVPMAVLARRSVLDTIQQYEAKALAS